MRPREQQQQKSIKRLLQKHFFIHKMSWTCKLDSSSCPFCSWLTVSHHHHGFAHNFSPGDWWPSISSHPYPICQRRRLLSKTTSCISLANHYFREAAAQILNCPSDSAGAMNHPSVVRPPGYIHCHSVSEQQPSEIINYELQIMEISNVVPLSANITFLHAAMDQKKKRWKRNYIEQKSARFVE